MGTKSRTLSITSTILLTIYTVCLVLAEAGMFAICKFAAHMINAGIGLASDSIAAGGCVIDYATPGTVAGGMLAGLGGTAWIVLTSFMVFLFIICTVYIAITAISYALVNKGYYKAVCMDENYYLWSDIPWIHHRCKSFYVCRCYV